MTNAQMLEAVHIFYNESTNVMVSVQYTRELGLYKVERSDASYIQYMSMNSIIERRGSEKWEFLGVL